MMLLSSQAFRWYRVLVILLILFTGLLAPTTVVLPPLLSSSVAYANPICTLPTPGRPAKFEPANGQIYAGAGQSTPSEILPLINKGDPARKPSLVAFYDGIGDSTNTPAGYHLRYTLITAHNLFPGAMLQIGLLLPNNNLTALQQIGDGTYDTTIHQMAQAYKALGQPIFLRIGYEFNGPWHGPYDATAYKAAFRRVACIFREDEQANNVAFLWNAFDPTCDAINPNSHLCTNIQDWYPGDDVVDWFSFNFNTYAGYNITAAPGYSIGPTLRAELFKQQADLHNKPIMIGESTYNGAYYSTIYTWQDWFSGNANLSPRIGAFFPALRASGVKGYQFINENWPVVICAACMNWQNNEITNSQYPSYPTALNQYNQELATNASTYIFRDASYVNPVPIWVTASRNLPASVTGQAWQQARDEYALQSGYTYAVTNAIQSYGDGGNNSVTWDSVGTVHEIDVNLGVPSSVPSGYIHLNAYTTAGQGLTIYIGGRQVASGLSLAGIEHAQYAYTAADRNGSGLIPVRVVSPDGQQVHVRRIGLQAIAATAPAAPNAVQARATSSTITKLRWPAIGGATLYNIYRNGQLIGTSPTAWFADTNVVQGIPYTYTVSSWDTHSGEGLMSAAVASQFGKDDSFTWNTNGIWTVRLSTGSGWGSAWTYGPWGTADTKFLAGDFDGDGIDDSFTWDTNGIWTVRSSTGSGWGSAWTYGPWGTTGTKFLAGDFNGDGKDDSFAWDTNGIWTVRLSTGSGWGSAWTYGPWGTTGTKFLAGDFNGDGKDDSFAWNTNGIWTVRLSTGSGWGSAWTYGPWGTADTKFLAGDFNGDGKDDSFAWDTNGIWTVRLSTGSGWGSAWTYGPWGTADTKFLAGDFNGDGKDDIFAWDTNGTWTVRLSTGSGWGSAWTYGPWGTTGTKFLAGDFDGN